MIYYDDRAKLPRVCKPGLVRYDEKVGIMAYFLAKTDPETILAQLEHDGETTWDGVRNAQAVRVI